MGVWYGRGVGTPMHPWGYSVGKDEVSQWNAALRYACHPANRDWQLSQFLRTYAMNKRNRSLSFPRRPLSCQSKNEKHFSRDSFKGVKSKSCSTTLIPSMPYLLTLRAIMETLYCAVISLSSNSLVAMVPSVPSIVK